MTTRALGPGAGIGWLKQAVNLGRNNPKAIFGGAALMLGVVVLAALVISMAMGALGAAIKPGPAGTLALAMLTMLPLLLLMSALLVGYLRLLDAVEGGRPARAMDVFAGFRDMPTSVRAIVFMVVLTLAQNLLIVGLVSVLAPEFGAWYLQNMQSSMAGAAQPPLMQLPEGFGLAFIVILVIALFCYALQAIGLGQIALRGRDVAGAFADGVTGAARNLPALLLLALVMLLAAIVLALGVVIVAAIAGVLAKLVGAWLLVVIGVPLYVAFIVAMLVVMFGVMYFLWRDVSGDVPPPPTSNDAVAA